jgi:hypothetical protein
MLAVPKFRAGRVEPLLTCGLPTRRTTDTVFVSNRSLGQRRFHTVRITNCVDPAANDVDSNRKPTQKLNCFKKSWDRQLTVAVTVV